MGRLSECRYIGQSSGTEEVVLCDVISRKSQPEAARAPVEIRPWENGRKLHNFMQSDVWLFLTVLGMRFKFIVNYHYFHVEHFIYLYFSIDYRYWKTDKDLPNT